MSETVIRLSIFNSCMCAVLITPIEHVCPVEQSQGSQRCDLADPPDTVAG